MGVILDTSGFTLLNAGSTVSLKQDGRLLHSITYSSGDGAQGNGKALHISDNDIISSDNPSIGTVRDVAVDKSAPASINNPESVSDQTTNVETSEKVSLVVKPSVVFPASTTEFSVIRRDDSDSEKVLYGSWNFGDGTYVYGDVVDHTYLHVGAYIVTFQEHVTQNENDIDTATGAAVQQKIEVRFPQVSVEQFNEAFVRLHNHHTFDSGCFRVANCLF